MGSVINAYYDCGAARAHTPPYFYPTLRREDIANTIIVAAYVTYMCGVQCLFVPS